MTRRRKRINKTSTTKKQARAYRRRLAKDIAAPPERVYVKTGAASVGRHVCPICLTLIEGDQSDCGHLVPPSPKKLEKTKGPVPLSHLRLYRPFDRQTAERVADAILGQKKPLRGLDRISGRHRSARKPHL